MLKGRMNQHLGWKLSLLASAMFLPFVAGEEVQASETGVSNQAVTSGELVVEEPVTLTVDATTNQVQDMTRQQLVAELSQLVTEQELTDYLADPAYQSNDQLKALIDQLLAVKSQARVVTYQSAPVNKAESAVANQITNEVVEEVNPQKAKVVHQEVTTSSPYINAIAPYAVEVAKQHNLYPSVMIAQATLESGYGQSSLSKAPYYNNFGIKGSYNGASVSMMTTEWTGSGWIQIPQNFRDYPSYRESFEDNARLLRQGPGWSANYYAGTWKENTRSYRDATAALTGTYATDPGYAGKLNNLIATHGLTRYDDLAYGTSTSNYQPTPSASGSSVTPTNGTYTVVSGDTLSKIARQFSTTVPTLKANNGLTSDLILVGQVLRVNRGTTTPQRPQAPQKNETKPAPAAPTTKVNGTYTVVAGDTLNKIARQHSVTVPALKVANGLQSDLILVGQRLTIPGHTTSGNQQNQQNQKKPQKPQKPVAPAPSTSTSQTYRVVAGDTLNKIARQHGTTVAALKSANGLRSDLILVGQQLVVSASSSAAKPTQPVAPKPTPAPAPAPSSGQTYRVVAGDTLSKIARQYGTTVASLKAANGLRSDLILVGQSLTISGRSTAPVQNVSRPSAPAPSQSATHRVVGGDTLYGIAGRYGTSVQRLKQLNGLSGDLIIVGQTLRVK